MLRRILPPSAAIDLSPHHMIHMAIAILECYFDCRVCNLGADPLIFVFFLLFRGGILATGDSAASRYSCRPRCARHFAEIMESAVPEKQGDSTISVEQAARDLENFKHAHELDPNLPRERLEFLEKALDDGNKEEIVETEALLTEDSPYDEVRAAVRNTDGGEVANTVRAWILGMIFVTVGSALNMFLSMRSPAINFPSIVVQLLVYPIGCLWAKVMPMKVFNTFGLRWTLNTGDFTIKEHAVIVLMSNVSIGYAYSTDALLALQGKPFYNINLGWGFQILFTLSSQLIGIGLAGLTRRFIVWPAAMICAFLLAHSRLICRC